MGKKCYLVKLTHTSYFNIVVFIFICAADRPNSRECHTQRQDAYPERASEWDTAGDKSKQRNHNETGVRNGKRTKGGYTIHHRHWEAEACK